MSTLARDSMPTRKVMLLFCGIVMLAAFTYTVLPASATSANFTNVENCSGTGFSGLSGGNLISYTDAVRVTPAGPCGWVFVQGEYRVAGTSTWLWIDPFNGWYNTAFAQLNLFGYVQARNVAHTACNAGGPCPGSWPGRVYTQYP